MNTIKSATVAAMLLAMAPWTLPSYAASIPDNAAGIIKTSKGSVTIERGESKVPGPVGVAVMASDRIVTGADGSAGITLRDETRLALGPNTTLALNQFVFNSTTHDGKLDASVRRGTLAVVSGKLAKQSPTAVRFTTPASVLGVRGTEFVIDVEDE